MIPAPFSEPHMLQRALITIVVLLAAAGEGVTAPEKTRDPSILADPAVSPEPGWVELKIRIDPDAADRVLTVELDSRDFFRSSQIPLNGAQSLSTYWLRFEDLPAGDYVGRVTLERSDDAQLTAESTFRVIGATK
jgi:hypothetical protein